MAGASQELTVPALKARKEAGPPLVAVTAYDAFHGQLLAEAGIDIALVGDSLGMVIQGHETTLPVTLDEMVYHTRMVARGARGRTFLLSDLPFGAYQASPEEAVRSSVRLVKEGGAQAVKLEGGEDYLRHVAAIVSAMIPVVGHLGLLPQRVHAMGGYRVVGRSPEEADRILREAQALVSAGIFALVLEGVPRELAARITREVPVPVIGIGAGTDTDGQVLVIHDLLGWTPGERRPRFARAFADGRGEALRALGDYARAVRDRQFPSEEESFHRHAP
ncbi:MAG: 3-methyl-2-oxobutanoate hydroxymethyltransferase [Leptospirillia bacterium]